MSGRRSSVVSDLRRPFPCVGAPAYLAGAHDGLSAALAVRAGFSAIWASSFEIATSRLEPDADKLRRSAVAARLMEITAGVTVPVLVDGGTGFEAEGGLQISLRAFGGAGAAGVCLEDKREPRMNSLIGSSHALLSTLEMERKIDVCLRSRLRDDFLIFARTDALSAGEDAASVRERLICYSESQLDGVVLHIPIGRFDSIGPVLADLDFPVPLGVILCDVPPPTFERVAEYGFAFCVLPHIGIRAVVPALENAFKMALAPERTPQTPTQPVTVPQIDQLVGNLLPGKRPESHQPSVAFTCSHRDNCLNFRRDGSTFCSACGDMIRADHFHDGINHLRLCGNCFSKHLPRLEDVLTTLVSPAEEPESCFNSSSCHSFGVYTLLVQKSCSRCGKAPMPSHFHDVAAGKRICLECVRELGPTR